MKKDQNKKKETKWVVYQQVFCQIINFSTIFVLSWILLPKDFGLQTSVAVLLSFVGVFQTYGLKIVVVRLPKVEQNLLSTFFWVLTIFGLLLFILINLGSKYILVFLLNISDDVALVSRIVLVQSVTIIFLNTSAISEAILLRNLRFKKVFFANFFGFLSGGVLGILAGIWGFGVWALVIKQLVHVCISSTCYILYADWKPKFVFQYLYVRKEILFSSNLSLSKVANYFVRNIDYIIIGKFLGPNMLGQYSLAYKIMLLPLKNLSAVLVKVLYPTLAKLKREKQGNVGDHYLKAIYIVAILTFPAMAIISGFSNEIAQFFFGDKWNYLPDLLFILAWVGALQAITSPIGVLFQLSGRTDHMLYFTVTTSVLVGASVLIGVNWGLIGVALSYSLCWVFVMFPIANLIPSGYYNISFLEIIKLIAKPIIISLILFYLIFFGKNILLDYLDTRFLEVLVVFLMSISFIFVYVWLFKVLFQESVVKDLIRIFRG